MRKKGKRDISSPGRGAILAPAFEIILVINLFRGREGAGWIVHLLLIDADSCSRGSIWGGLFFFAANPDMPATCKETHCRLVQYTANSFWIYKCLENLNQNEGLSIRLGLLSTRTQYKSCRVVEKNANTFVTKLVAKAVFIWVIDPFTDP